jgi:hypothetical protein
MVLTLPKLKKTLDKAVRSVSFIIICNWKTCWDEGTTVVLTTTSILLSRQNEICFLFCYTNFCNSSRIKSNKICFNPIRENESIICHK